MISIFYNNTFDLRIVVMADDFHVAVEKLREYLYNNTEPEHRLKVSDFYYEEIDKIIQ